MPQPLKVPGPVVIEDEVWLGERVCVMPNVTIGKHSVIGANSVVTKDIPPYCIAVGVPARIIKQYNHNKKQWEIIHSE
jgi:lipopolysaccharide O-acetyltransferase